MQLGETTSERSSQNGGGGKGKGQDARPAVTATVSLVDAVSYLHSSYSPTNAKGSMLCDAP